MDLGIAGKVVFFTGGSKGMGRIAARMLAVYCTFGTTSSPASVCTVNAPPVNENDCVPRVEPMVAVAVPLYSVPSGFFAVT